MKPFLPFQVFRAGLFSDVSAWDSYSLHILDFVELRVPSLISHKRRRALASHSRKSFIPVQPRGLADAFSPAGADRLLLSEAPAIYFIWHFFATGRGVFHFSCPPPFAGAGDGDHQPKKRYHHIVPEVGRKEKMLCKKNVSRETVTVIAQKLFHVPRRKFVSSWSN